MAKVSHGAKGFHITFDNGYTVSIQYGKGNYCSRRDYHFFSTEPDPSEIECKDFEMAVWGSDGKWLQLTPTDDVVGYISFEHLPKILEYTKLSKFEALKWYLREMI